MPHGFQASGEEHFEEYFKELAHTINSSVDKMSQPLSPAALAELVINLPQFHHASQLALYLEDSMDDVHQDM